MDDFKLTCLPVDFVGNSKPSKKLDAFYKKKAQEEQTVIANLHEEQRLICHKYTAQFQATAEELKLKLDKLKGLIKSELYNCTTSVNRDRANSIDKFYFTKIYKRIHDYTRQQNDLIGEFYANLEKTEQDKAKEFQKVLKKTYEDVKSISYRPPNECDELIELELEKVNQTILCNDRNYAELKFFLQTEIENYNKNAVQDLQFLKEYWIKYIRSEVDKSARDLQNLYNPNITSQFRDLNTFGKEMSERLLKVESLVKTTDCPLDWLNRIREILSLLDQKAQKLMLSYKRASVMVYNRFFEDLKIVEETLRNMPTVNQVSDTQIDMYAPNPTQIAKIYDADLETVKQVWNDLVDGLIKKMDKIIKFIEAASVLWGRHFHRTKVLQTIILRDMENTVQRNNDLCELYESKLNVLIDTLRQEPTKEKLNKTLGEVKVVLTQVEEQYNVHHQSEIALLKKYQEAFNLLSDILVEEVKRFLEVYPPDKELDPKICRARASQTNILADPFEKLIPNQMFYFKFQIGAISNWQFGLWESINNYLEVAKADVQAEIDQWIQRRLARAEVRKNIRLSYHRSRINKIQAYIYEERLEELGQHQNRWNEHKMAVQRRLPTLKDEFKLYTDKWDLLVEEYKKDILNLTSRCVNSQNSCEVASIRPVLKARTRQTLQSINSLAEEYLENCCKFAEEVKASHVILLRNIRFFHEGGNFSPMEIKSLVKETENVEGQMGKGLTNITKDIEMNKDARIGLIEAHNSDLLNILQAVQEEHVFIENLQKNRSYLQKALTEEVCKHQFQFQSLSKEFAELKLDAIANCGLFMYFQEFTGKVKTLTDSFTGKAKYLDVAVPVRFCADKSLTNQSEDFTGKLFNFDTNQWEDTYFNNLNKRIFDVWNQTVQDAKNFYKSRQEFYLDQAKLPRDFEQLVHSLYDTYVQIQTQCETRVIRDTKQFLSLANNCLLFLVKYFDNYMDDYSKKSLKQFEQFYESDVKHIIQKEKRLVLRNYEQLKAKLKPLYGHPSNKNILEKLQVEAEIIHSDAKEVFLQCKQPYLEILDERFRDAVTEFIALSETLPDFFNITRLFKEVMEDLNEKLDQKIDLLRVAINTNETLLDCCKSFLNELAPCSAKPSELVLLPYKDFDSPSPFLVSISSSVTKQSPKTIESFAFKSRSTVSSNTFGLQTDPFLLELKGNYSKFLNEVETENFEIFLDTLKAEWLFAVQRVRDLYTPKYDDTNKYAV